MKITYDASLLGSGHYGAKTGLFQVASNLIAGLLDASIKEDPAGEISLCTSLSFDVLMSTCEYLANDQQLQAAKFIGGEHGQGWRKSIYKLALAAIGSKATVSNWKTSLETAPPKRRHCRQEQRPKNEWPIN